MIENNGNNASTVTSDGADSEESAPSRPRQTSATRVIPKRTSKSSSVKRDTHRVVRWLHVYTSMISLMLVLFFSVTGITLNHPDWVFGSSASRKTISGTMPDNWKTGDKVDWLVVTEKLRNTDGIRGAVGDHRSDANEADVSFRGPGYSADAFVDMNTGKYQVTVNTQGLLGVMNDLHKGRDTLSSWKWLIDVSAGLLVVISLTGLGIQFFLRKRRRSAFTSVGVGTVIAAALIWLATR